MTSRLLACFAVLLSGCAGMAEGTVDQSREILLTSSPSDARVSQGGPTICRTPCTVRQQRLNLLEPLVFEFPDGRRAETRTGQNWNATTLGNAAFGGPLGVAMDVISGRVILADRHIHAVAEDQAAGTSE
jgi:hypothetical protein